MFENSIKINHIAMESNSYKSFKVVIADDHGVARKGMGLFCKEVFTYCTLFECDSIEGLYKVMREEKEIDLLILDIYIGDYSSLQHISVLKNSYKNLKILVVSMGDEEIYGVKAMREGVQGFISKMSSDDEIKDAIRTVASGTYFLTKKLRKISAGLFSSRSQYSLENPFLALTSQEFHVCIHLLKGHDVNEIADRMNLSATTISTYKCRVLTKLEVKRMNELMKLAVEYNIENKIMN